MPNPLRNQPYYWVPAGLLEDGRQLEVAAHVFVGSKASWDAIPAQGVRHETIPELSPFLALLHDANST